MAVTTGDGGTEDGRTVVRVSAVVPTLGATPLLGECLRGLRRQVPGRTPFALEIVLVRQGDRLPEEPSEQDLDTLVDRQVRLPRPVGFAAAANRGIAQASGDHVATVNDDAVVGEGWLGALVDALETDPEAASAQGTNVTGWCGDRRIDGHGLGWNRWVQAVQLGHGEPASPARGGGEGIGCEEAEPPRRVFGVSATAALYRRTALLSVARPPRHRDRHRHRATGPEVFDRRLHTYYEDADLARRLRAAGYAALSVPAAPAIHAGSATGAQMGTRRWRLIHGNRYPVAAGLLGRSFWRHLPRMVLRDLIDLGRAVSEADLGRAAGIVGGWGRALRLLPGFLRCGAAVPGALDEPWSADGKTREGGR